MTITPQDIQAKQFHVRMRGFDVDEVDKFLEKVAEEFLIITLENKQILDKIESMEKELANFKNKEQAFQNAIVSAQRISDEMQAKSRMEAQERTDNAKAEAEELLASTQEEVDGFRSEVNREVTELLEKSRQDANKLKSDAAEEARQLGENAKIQHAELIKTINELVAMKDRIVNDIRQLLSRYMERLNEGFPAGLADLTPLPLPDEFESLADSGATFELRDPDSLDDLNHEDVFDPDLDNLYEKLELLDEQLPDEAEMTTAEDGQPATLEDADIKPVAPEDEYAGLTNLPIPNLDGDEDMLFTLEDPMDELEPTVLINKDDKP